jgi:hypothetical protein
LGGFEIEFQVDFAQRRPTPCHCLHFVDTVRVVLGQVGVDRFFLDLSSGHKNARSGLIQSARHEIGPSRTA